GFTLDEVANRVGAKTHITTADFKAAAKNATLPSVLQQAHARSLEGVLFPETYFVGDRETASELIGRMEGEFETKTSTLDWSAAKVSRYQVLIIAALIE